MATGPHGGGGPRPQICVCPPPRPIPVMGTGDPFPAGYPDIRGIVGKATRMRLRRNSEMQIQKIPGRQNNNDGIQGRETRMCDEEHDDAATRCGGWMRDVRRLVGVVVRRVCDCVKEVEGWEAA
ncbi:hypothetical protein PIB30_030781 [Stylosanthes scabra]|uniref:Uncharacterized protein n=1 Tax=Stylosanthes scabra TaxID=79078 RepID=A0ABU6ZAT1_9FABA|nr:hypothetical protein [Stylosanthes scabra]